MIQAPDWPNATTHSACGRFAPRDLARRNSGMVGTERSDNLLMHVHQKVVTGTRLDLAPSDMNLRSHPLPDSFLQYIQRQGAVIEHLIMELADIKTVSQRFGRKGS